ncbi:MAG: T9SS type A sorting domain-containing protein, partial [Balneolaceae bacterium]|nr:T9SS type A sorting domain-containing protein [Balneolaceae bacterium]
QNYPNPFNPTTQISYSIPQQSDVLLEVYDLTGKLITTLVNETVSSGTHSVTFDAENLSSGVYMYRLQTANRVLSRKLTVIK